MNCFMRPQPGGWKNGWQVPNIIISYRSTLGFFDQANAYYHLSYHYLQQTLKHTCTQFISIFFITLINLWLIYKHVKGDKDYMYHSYLRNLAEALAQAGGHHQK